MADDGQAGERMAREQRRRARANEINELISLQSRSTSPQDMGLYGESRDVSPKSEAFLPKCDHQHVTQMESNA